MRTLALISQKGGAGKTTLAFHLAVQAESTGKATIVFDTDTQGSAGKLSDLRSPISDVPEVIDAHAKRLGSMLTKVAAKGADLAVIDTAPHTQSDAVEVARVADFILIPCRPAVLDVDAIRSTVDVLSLVPEERRAGSAVVLNAVRPRSESLVREIKETLASMSLTIAPMQLGNRAAFSDSLIDGRVAAEYEPGGKAANEVRLLFEWVWQQMEG